MPAAGHPRTPADLVRLSLRDRVRHRAIVGYHLATGRWRYPAPTSGDFETMSEVDKVYWIYKAGTPHTRAVLGSGLEAYFESAKCHPWSLPEGFAASHHARLSAAGDLMDHPSLPYSAGYLYEAVADTVLGADLAMANLECVVDPEGEGELIIRPDTAPPLYYRRAHFDAVKGHEGRSFDLLATANNHSLDSGVRGVRSTREALGAEGIASSGINDSPEDAERTTLIVVRGITIAVVAWTFGLNGRKPPVDQPWLVNRAQLNGRPRDADLSRLERQLAWCREVGADFVVAQLHWGLEHELYPRPEQLEMAHHLVELGVDLLIGHHPHVVQPMEAYRTRRDPARVVPIFYSLGNLVCPFSHPLYRRGGVAEVHLSKGQDADGVHGTYVRSARLRHVEQQHDDRGRLRLVSLC